MDKLKFFDSPARSPDSIPRLHLSKKIRFLSTDQRVTTSCRLPPPSTHCSQTTCCRQTTRCRQPPRQDLPSILVHVDKKCYLTSKSSIFPSLPTFLFFSFSGSFGWSPLQQTARVTDHLPIGLYARTGVLYIFSLCQFATIPPRTPPHSPVSFLIETRLFSFFPPKHNEDERFDFSQAG